jgi:histidyl-tRNA synthetase
MPNRSPCARACGTIWALQGIRLEINSLGQSDERARHRADLLAYLEQHQDQLDEDARRRLHSNPLRILDTKNPQLQALVEGAPKLIDYLGEASLKHFDGVQQLLKDAAIPYRINPRLVRGLDYYNLTVFEWVTDQLGAQGTVCAGGRYDGLISQLGGKPHRPAGLPWASSACWRSGRIRATSTKWWFPDAYLVHQGEAAARFAFRVAEALRSAGFAIQLHCGGGSFKSQMKKADGSGAPVALIVGDDEAAANSVSVKPLRGGYEQPSEQQRVGFDELADHLGALLFPMEDDDGSL